MSHTIFVGIMRGSQTVEVGTLYCHTRGDHQSATFVYDSAWVTSPHGFELAPDMPMGRGPLQTPHGQALFGPFADTAPDRWGRMLIQRAAAMSDEPRTLLEADYLMRVSDFARQGALRFAFAETPDQYEAPPDRMPVPPMTDLKRLVGAADRVERDTATPEDIKLLVEPGSSIGGARPKASIVLDNKRLAIAKFPAEHDTRSMARWEALGLTLASDAGIQTPDHWVTSVGGCDVLLVDRFDRGPSGHRIPYLSAMTMLGARDGDVRSYIEIADVISQHGIVPAYDREQLWRRLCLNILISNMDDHLRNHGFVYHGGGWRLAPVFDLNPVPLVEKGRWLATRIGIEDHTARADLMLAIEHAPYFNLTHDEALRIVREVGTVVANWRQRADELGIPTNQTKRMASAFEHADLEFALSQGPK